MAEELVGVKRVPIVDRSSGEPREVGWAHVTEDGTVIDQDITDPEMIMKLQERVLSSSFAIAHPENKKAILAEMDRIVAEEFKPEIPDTFKA